MVAPHIESIKRELFMRFDLFFSASLAKKLYFQIKQFPVISALWRFHSHE